MGFLSVHDETPTHPKDNPEVIAKGRDVEQARLALTAIEQRARELELDRESPDELRRWNAAHELGDVRQQYIGLKADVLTKQREYDRAFQAASVPWRAHWQDIHREAARTFLTWLETEALPANDAMLAAQAAAEQAGLHVDQLHIPQLLAEAVEHRCRIARQGLG